MLAVSVGLRGDTIGSAYLRWNGKQTSHVERDGMSVGFAKKKKQKEGGKGERRKGRRLGTGREREGKRERGREG